MLLPQDQLTVLVVGALVPLLTYAINFYAPWVSEKVKAVVLLVVAAVAAGVYQAVDASSGFEWNGQTRQYIITAVVGALSAHKLLWAPSTISTAFGGGRNKQATP